MPYFLCYVNYPRHVGNTATLAFPSKQAFMDRYNQRGAAEIEQFRADKDGLHLSSHRKRSSRAQKAIVLLTDLTHNLLADFRYLRWTQKSRHGNRNLKSH